MDFKKYKLNKLPKKTSRILNNSHFFFFISWFCWHSNRCHFLNKQYAYCIGINKNLKIKLLPELASKKRKKKIVFTGTIQTIDFSVIFFSKKGELTIYKRRFYVFILLAYISSMIYKVGVLSSYFYL